MCQLHCNVLIQLSWQGMPESCCNLPKLSLLLLLAPKLKLAKRQ